MSDYRWSRLTAQDLQAWSDLCNHLAVVDGTEEFESPEDLAENLTMPGRDMARDSWAVWAGEELAAYGLVSVPRSLDHEGMARTYLGGGVREEHRGRGLGTLLMDRLEERGMELLAERHPGTEAYHGAGGGLEGSSARDLLQGRGFEVVRYFNLLSRPLGDEPEVPALPGVELVSPGPEHEAAVLEAHNSAFRDHWGSGEIWPDSWHQSWTARSHRPEVSTIAVATEGPSAGAVQAYVLVGQWVDREAYVNLVGTIPQARGRGLAAACLGRTIGLASRSGAYDVIELDVDSDSPTGATRLYERMGFSLKHQTAALRRPVGEVGQRAPGHEPGAAGSAGEQTGKVGDGSAAG